MVTIKFVDMDVFKARLLICVGTDWQYVRQSTESWFGKPDINLAQAQAMASYGEDGAGTPGMFGIFLNGLDDHEGIAHETFHIVFRVLLRMKVIPEKDNHEIFAYLAGYISKHIYSIREGLLNDAE